MIGRHNCWTGWANVEAYGGYQAIWRREDPRVYFGGSDPRKDGAAMGY